MRHSTSRPAALTPRAKAGLLNRLQAVMKKTGLYYFLLYTFSPVFGSLACRRHMKALLAENGAGRVVVNLGSGPQIFKGRKDIINIDLEAFPNVQVVADATRLPLGGETVDLIFNVALSEHVVQPEAIVAEMRRVLRPGGRFFCYLPFLVPYHAAPDDFWRWTGSGAGRLFPGFTEVSLGIGAGPTSGLLWVLQEWLAVALSFGSRSLHDLLLLLLMPLTAPLKLLDLVLVHVPHADKIASGFFVVGRKPASRPEPAPAPVQRKDR